MNILHTEASNGWGGQEIRILREAEGMRERGHTLIFATVNGAKLAQEARKKGFQVYELPFSWRSLYRTIPSLIRILIKHKIELINTHSSMDAWLGGIAARLAGVKILRTRHLSTPIKTGLNSRILYKTLAHATVTTCQEVADKISLQANIAKERCRSIPTGVDFSTVQADGKAFRSKHGFKEDDIVIGTVCILRSWKGIQELLYAAEKLKHIDKLKWLIVGSGPSEERYQLIHRDLGLNDKVVFTGFLQQPTEAISAMDIFLLLSTAHEGVSQASLQAAYLGKPLITTPTGGLQEVCIQDITGYLVPPFDADQVAKRVEQLAFDRSIREKFGQEAKRLVIERFSFTKTLDDMEKMYKIII